MQQDISCPVCFEELSAPIRQCKNGHSLCDNCFNKITKKICPTCRATISNGRNYQMEQLIASLKHVIIKSPCLYASNGCKHELPLDEKETHEWECKFREFICEGKKFANWNCNWRGGYSNIMEHFKTTHFSSSIIFGKENNIVINLDLPLSDVIPIAYGPINPQLFWYKHRVDPVQEKVYWVIQYVGLKSKAENYHYEFEIYEGPIRKLKTTEICESDSANVNEIFKSEKCVTFSFQRIKNYLNKKGELTFRFRIMKINQSMQPSTSNQPKQNISDLQIVDRNIVQNQCWSTINIIWPLMWLTVSLFLYYIIFDTN